ncbi:MAG: ribose ABC transporter substrate-binding protein, partial [Verrucomicrobia bacterium]|nr:ribose ABC transporter substrate-binding protein [Verrucomicrobiota bacterium]
PNMKEGQDYYPDLNDNFFVGNSFPACNIGFTANEIMGKSETNQ